MLVLRNGAGEPEVTADLFSIEGARCTRRGDAAVYHFEANNLALGAAGSLHGQQGVAADELAFVELEPALEAGFEDVDLFGDFVAVEAHAGLQAQRVARAQAAGADAELAAGIQQRVPHLSVVGSSAGM
jgi:hypothetical protein